jgi:lipid-binding SYLF domain-containing protein
MDDKGIPMDTLHKAVCVIVIPNLKKGGFIVGAKYGKGFVSCRKQSGAGWTAPGAMRIEGGSFGFLIGGAETDLILLVMNKEGAQKLLADKFTLGTDATAAAGPVGRSAAAETDAQLTAGILSYSRSRGAFAGVAFTAGTLRQDLDDNQALYGTKLGNKELMAGTVKVPAAADGLIAALDGLSVTRQK